MTVILSSDVLALDICMDQIVTIEEGTELEILGSPSLGQTLVKPVDGEGEYQILNSVLEVAIS